ncbi:cell division protein FtsQ/DivIB [Apilactobacillus ozensis]|uniref:cell division protein FtsQ/DivIB n=1 Tax=Apilactobacillus ozensis TaxID=866801 RepID=UPI00200ADF94|nr:cell division protein FtsQ/DivIB [Apilactobacillus ozensis]MCK8607288.1 cell division protein FtsQ/DivIB [Apilactobacillus ozensis]
MKLNKFLLNNIFKSHSTKDKKKRVLPLDNSRKKSTLKKFLVFFVPLFLVLLISLYFISPLSKINSISVVGNNIVSKSYIKNKASVHVGDSVFKVIGKNKLLNEKLTKNNSQIKHANFKMNGINNVKIYIEQYKVIGYNSDKNNRAYPILESGKVLSSSVDNPNTDKLPYLVNFTNNEQRKYVVKVMNNLPSYIKNNIRVISFNPTSIFPDGLRLYMRDGNKVYVLISNFKSKMPYYHSIASKLKSKSVIKLEVGAYSYPQSNR